MASLVPTVKVQYLRSELPYYRASVAVEEDGSWSVIHANGPTPEKASEDCLAEVAAFFLRRDGIDHELEATEWWDYLKGSAT